MIVFVETYFSFFVSEFRVRVRHKGCNKAWWIVFEGSTLLNKNAAVDDMKEDNIDSTYILYFIDCCVNKNDR